MASVGPIVDMNAGVELSMPNEIDESLTPEEQAQMDALSRGEDPTEVEVPEGTEQLKVDEPDAEGEEVEAAPEAEAAPVEKPSARVPLPELQKERERRKALQKEYDELRDKYARGDERLRMIEDARRAEWERQQALQQQQQQQIEDPEPDRDLDPMAWYEWKIRQQDQQMASLAYNQQQYQYNLQQREQAQQVQQQWDTYYRELQHDEAQFAASTPDYNEKLTGLRDHLDALFAPIYPDANVRGQWISYWTRQTVAAAQQLGKSPSQVVYEVANAIPYARTPQEAQQAVTQALQRPNMNTMRRAQATSRTLSNAQGSAPKMPPSLEELADMDEDAWEQYSERHPNTLRNLHK